MDGDEEDETHPEEERRGWLSTGGKKWAAMGPAWPSSS